MKNLQKSIMISVAQLVGAEKEEKKTNFFYVFLQEGKHWCTYTVGLSFAQIFGIAPIRVALNGFASILL